MTIAPPTFKLQRPAAVDPHKHSDLFTAGQGNADEKHLLQKCDEVTLEDHNETSEEENYSNHLVPHREALES